MTSQLSYTVLQFDQFRRPTKDSKVQNIDCKTPLTVLYPCPILRTEYQFSEDEYCWQSLLSVFIFNSLSITFMYT